MYTKAQVPFIAILLLLVSGTAFAATGNISTSDASPVISSGHLGTVTIRWSSSGVGTAEVWVSMDGSPETLMSRSPSGAATPNWIQPGHDYQFTLYADTNHTLQLASTSVIGVPQGGGNVTASLLAVEAEAKSSGTTIVSWATDGQPSAEVWVSMDSQPETLMGRAPSGTSTTPWIVPGHDYQFNLYAGTTHTRLLDTVRVWGELAYKVGVDYHATGTDFVNTAFVKQYDTPSVRSTVQSQLQGIADGGATVIHTRLWMVTGTGGDDFGQAWRTHFPLSAQEVTNLRTYAQDVAAIRAADGHRLRLDLTLLWIGDSSYQMGTPATGLGYSKLPVAEFTSRVKQTISSVLGAVGDIVRADGRRLVDTIYMDGEVMVGAKPNTEWFLTTHYPDFVTAVRSAGMNPSLYLLVAATEAEVLDNTFVDGTYPVLNGHRSMYWVYRTLRFMHDQGLPLPQRLDWSCYPAKTSATYATLIERIFNDADATLPSLGLAKKYGVAETMYLLSASERQALGQAFAAERLTGGRLGRLEFWTTPDGGGTGVDVAYPFSMKDYLP
jgi:hypothetical protein